MMNIVKIGLSIIVVALLCFLLNVTSMKRSKRIRQFPMIIILFIVMVVGVALLTRLAGLMDIITNKVPFLFQANILFLNLVLLIAAVVFKLALKPVINLICKKPVILQFFDLSFYLHDEDYDEWFLKKRYTGFRKYIFGIVCALVLISGLFIGLTWIKGPGSAFWLLLFPCAALAVVNEIFCYVNGQTKEEYEYSVTGVEADSRRISNYYKLREILEQLFPESLLTAHTGNEFEGRKTAADLLKRLEEAEDQTDRIIGQFFNLNGRYKTADVDCVQATLDMIHHKNVVFFNPFYKDLTLYITLPLVHSLLSGKKAIVLCGRNNIVKDVKDWMKELLKDYSRMRTLWRVSNLSIMEPDCEVGILSSTQIYDKQILNANRELFHKADFVLIIEPSIMLNTSQVALSILAEEMNDGETKPVYCICDRYTDGLIDTMSHVLRSEILDVVAMPVPRNNYTAMSWDADGDFCRQELFDKQTKYLGNGVELSAVAIKNQIPAVIWYSDRKAPVRDIKWIAGQNYSTICQYMNLPAQQSSLYEKIQFVSTLWSATKKKEQFLIAEDEFCNMFNVMREYLSRGENQIFVNVLSENYLLRDYMRCNAQMFMSNPNAVPSCVPDYAKTERNTILKLILLMTLRPVEEEEILKELHLAGIDTTDTFNELKRLLKEYTYADDSIFTIYSQKKKVNQFSVASTEVYRVTDESFEEFFSESLKNAYFILEEEKDETNYIDAKLFSHVTQMTLPGQFVIYDGKYYQVKYVSPQSGVILRRASDLYSERHYYRQLRTYHLDLENNMKIISSRKVMDIEFAELRTDFSVETSGYLDMKSYHNLRTAKLVDFTEDPSVSNFSRKYRNKSVLRIKLPEANDRLCFTICLLLSEVFRSVFPDGWQYLAVTTKLPSDVDGMLNYVVYPMIGETADGYVYIIEDSDLDLGLLDAVEKNFMRLMELIADFLDWHFEKMREPAYKDAIPEKIQLKENAEKKRRSLVVRMLARIRRLFGGKKEEKVKIEEVSQVETKPVDEKPAEAKPIDTVDGQQTESAEEKATEEQATFSEENQSLQINEESVISVGTEESDKKEELLSDNTENPVKEKKQATYPEDDFEPKDTNDADLVHIDGTDIFDNEGMPEDNDYLEMSFEEMGLTPITKSRYQKECYLKFGFEEIDGRIQVEELRQYLRVRGWSNNALTHARTRAVMAKQFLDVNAENICDFCGLPLSGVSYDRLNDGRVRCNNCSASAITTVNDFKELFHHCLDLMQDFYSIKYRVPIAVRVTNAREVAKGAGMVFKPSTGFAARVLGFAQRKHGKYRLVVENGSPRLAAIDTIVHEMTHIWQYLNWDDSQIISIYGMNSMSCTLKARDIVYEGMAMWASIQYLYSIGESYYAAQQEAMIEAKSDIYGIGFRLYRERYPFVKDGSLVKYSPFTDFPMLEPEDVRNEVRKTCTQKECIC